MGQFRIVIEAMGGHGEQREVGDGGKLDVYAYPDGAVDKAAFDLVKWLKAHTTVSSATLTHWPGTEAEVVDDLVERVRHGSFTASGG